MAVEGFTSLKHDAKAFQEALNQRANRSYESTSPFQEGMKFKLAQDPIDIVRNAEGKAFTILWLDREDGTKAELWLSTLEKRDSEGGREVRAEAEINVEFRKRVDGHELTNKEFAQAFIDLVAGRQFQVARTYYTRSAMTRYGLKSFPASLVGFKFVD